MWDVDYEYLEKQLLKDRVHEAVGFFLNDRERTAIVCVFFKDMNLTETAKWSKISRERIRQIHNKALRKLKANRIFFKEFFPYHFEKKIQPNSVNQEYKSPSVTEIHPCFREAYFFCKKIKLIKKEEMRRKADIQREEIIKERKRKEEENILRISNTRNGFDDWYEKMFGRPLKEY